MSTGDKMTDDTLATALARAQAQMRNPVADATNPQYRSRYADLAGVRDAVIPCLAAEGIAITQDELSEIRDGDVLLAGVRTSLHWRGERQDYGPLWLPVIPIVSRDGKEQALAHALGSVLTYLRRYTLSAVACIASEPDDDGNASGGSPRPKPTPSPEHRTVPQPTPPGPRLALREALRSAGASNAAQASAALRELGAKVDRFDAITDVEAERLLAVIAERVQS